MNKKFYYRRIPIFIFVLCLTAALHWALIPSRIASAESIPDVPELTDSTMCIACHSKDDQSIVFSNQENLSVQIDPEKYRSSVHADLECSTCHPGMESYPHPENETNTLEEYRLAYHDSCKGCHSEQFDEVSMSVHEKLFDQGVEGTPLCSDCHQPHSQVPLCDPDEAATIEDRIWIAETCAACHGDLYQTYRESIHGLGLLEENNPDMPTCIDCHSVHAICDPNEAGFRINSLSLCADCHTDPAIMDKYGHDVNVLNTYVVFHDTTVTMLEQYNDDSLTSKPTCYDCHGIHEVDNMSNPPTAVFDMPAENLYPPIKAEEEPAPVRNVAVTGALLGVLVGSAGTMTITQLIKENKKNGNGDK